MKPQLIKSKDGSHTLYLSEMDEQYHSQNGAITESLHIYIKCGYLHQNTLQKTVFEVGFGTGLNCLLTAIESEKQNIVTTYISIEKYPLPADIIDKLNYPALLDKKASIIFNQIHDAKWNQKTTISTTFHLLKIKTDLITDPLPILPLADVIYYDAFGPDKQPEIWELPVLKKIDSITNVNGVFVTYSVKGLIKRRLESLQYKIEKLPGPPGKKEILRGIKKG